MLASLRTLLWPPPFNEPDFNTPQLGAETLLRPSVILEVWRNLKDKPLLTQNYDAYSYHLCYLSGPTFKAITVKQVCWETCGCCGSSGLPTAQPLPGTEPTWAPGPAHSDFLQKMDSFWLLKGGLKKKMQPLATVVTLPLEVCDL
ncbi:hypothetical protein FD755_024142 [Muntiacus reevesi]|uniref:Uncharacterized protein n=1 Tax=Muntiacus reevesi TaxID=9886 RepID=A0A5N3VUY5_MUNRE|nr:hypothetical protein FD755_024142 [Muntiacus reevesi]